MNKTEINNNNQNINIEEENKMTNTIENRIYRAMTPRELHELAKTDAAAKAELERRQSLIDKAMVRIERKGDHHYIDGYRVYFPEDEGYDNIRTCLDLVTREWSNGSSYISTTSVFIEEYKEYNIPILLIHQYERIPLYRALFYETAHRTYATFDFDKEMVKDVDGYLIPANKAIVVPDYGIVDINDTWEHELAYAWSDGERIWVHQNDVFCCDSCGKYLYAKTAHINELPDGRYVCDGCLEEIRVEEFARSAEDFPGFFGDDYDQKRFGIELEIDGGGDEWSKAMHIVNGDPSLVAKHDCSLDYGIEIVSGACTMDYHKTEVDWEGVIKRALDLGYQEDADTAGLHIHISRCFFNSPESEIRFGKFFNDNFEEIADIWHRTKFGYCGWYEDDYDWQRIIGGRYERYYCVNYCNTNTIEVRIFSGYLKYELLMSALEFVDVVSELANRKDPITWDLVYSFAKEKKYHCLMYVLSR